MIQPLCHQAIKSQTTFFYIYTTPFPIRHPHIVTSMSLCFDVQLKIIAHHSSLQCPENPNTTLQISLIPSWVFVKISSLAPIHSLKQEQIHTSIISTGLITLFYKLHKKCCRFELLHLKERFVTVVRGSKTHYILFTLNLTYSPQMSDNRSHSHPSTNLALLLYLQ